MLNKYFLILGCLIMLSCDAKVYDDKSNSQKETIQKIDASDANQTTSNELYQKIYEGNANITELLSIFELRDKLAMANLVNVLARYKKIPEINDALMAAWSINKVQFPDMAWDNVEEPIVRISIAQVLYRTTKSPEYKEYIYKLIEHKDTEIRSAAIRNIGIIGSDNDIERLRQLIISSDTYVAGNAITALSVLRTKRSKESLEELVSMKNLSQEKKQIISKVLKSEIWAE